MKPQESFGASAHVLGDGLGDVRVGGGGLQSDARELERHFSAKGDKGVSSEKFQALATRASFAEIQRPIF